MFYNGPLNAIQWIIVITWKNVQGAGNCSCWIMLVFILIMIVMIVVVVDVVVVVVVVAVGHSGFFIGLCKLSMLLLLLYSVIVV
jgi:hypothetical protein